MTDDFLYKNSNLVQTTRLLEVCDHLTKMKKSSKYIVMLQETKLERMKEENLKTPK